MFESLYILRHQGKQYIPDLDKAEISETFAMGMPVISPQVDPTKAREAAMICPTGAFKADPVQIDLGSCVFCGECERICGKDQVRFTNRYRTATNQRERLVVASTEDTRLWLDETKIRKEIRRVFGRSLKLRQVSAGGDSSAEWELNACSNVNFDMGRFGIEFVASPRHADGLVITGPVTQNMAEPLRICYEAIPDPKVVILVGTDAISGGIFAHSPAIERRFLDTLTIDLYVPGNPPHPLTFIHGVLDLIGYTSKRK